MFNETKCSLLSIEPANENHHHYFINNQPIISSSLQKDLGILVSSDLSWYQHISKVTSKAYNILGLLCWTFSSTNNTTTKKQLYVSLVRSQILYGSQIWRPILTKDINVMESLQHRATKYILNDYNSDYRTRLIKLHLLPIAMLLELNDICFFITSLKNPDSFDILDFVSFSSNPTRSRSHSKLVQPVIKSNRDKQLYFNRLPYLWNSLPIIDLSLFLDSIKRNLKELF